MYIRQPFKNPHKSFGATPAWHTPVREISAFSKIVDTRCGKKYILTDSELEFNIPNGERPCGTCYDLSRGKMTSWASTGYRR